MGSDVIVQKLNRDHRQQRAEQLIHSGNREQHVEQLCIRALEGHTDLLGIASLGFLSMGQHLVEHLARHRDRHHQQPRTQQRSLAVLHLAGRLALGIDVADLLELQGALRGDRAVDAAP